MNSQSVTKLTLLLLVVGAISCMDEPKLNREGNSLVQVKNGYLEFRDQRAYDEVRQQLNTMSSVQLNNWERSLPGFISIRSIYDQATIEEEAFFENGGSVYDHSDFFKQHIGALTFESEDILLPNLPPQTERRLSSFVNENGIVKIGNTIFEYRSRSIKEIRDGDESKIKLLNDYAKSDFSQNIIVTRFTQIDFDNSQIQMRTAFGGNSNCTGYTSGGGQRVKGSVTLFAAEKNEQGWDWYQVYVDVNAVNQEKKLGVWLGKRTSQLAIVGDVNVGPPSDWGSFSVDINTNGDLKTSIGLTYNFPDKIIAYTSGYPYMTGSLTFWGRQGSTCSF